MAPAFGWINSGFSRRRQNIYSDYIWRIYKSENWGSQEVRWQSADLLTQRPMTGELFPTLLKSTQPTLCQINYCRTYFPPIWDLIYYQTTESTLPVNIHCKATTCGNLVADLLNDSSKIRQSASVNLFSCRSSYVLPNNVEDTRNFAEFNQRS